MLGALPDALKIPVDGLQKEKSRMGPFSIFFPFFLAQQVDSIYD
jgi:hypothetical protein